MKLTMLLLDRLDSLEEQQQQDLLSLRLLMAQITMMHREQERVVSITPQMVPGLGSR